MNVQLSTHSRLVPLAAKKKDRQPRRRATQKNPVQGGPGRRHGTATGYFEDSNSPLPSNT